MKIGGLQPFTLSDYPDCCAAIIFTIGCNFRCPYCHNKILLDNNAPQIPIEKIFNFLKEKQGKLDGVVISGGEPTIQEDLFAFIQQVKELGYKIKLDTNGSNPAIIKRLLDANLLDYIAMDIKAPIPVRDARFCAPATMQVDSSSLVLQQGVSAVNKRSLLDINEHCEQGHNEAASQNTKSLYDKLAGTNINPTTIHNSINIIVNSKIKHIFRTTWDKTLLSEHDINAIKTFLPPNSNFVLQECQKSY